MHMQILQQTNTHYVWVAAVKLLAGFNTADTTAIVYS